MSVIVTVPHAVCLNRLARDCDRVAEKAARHLVSVLKETGKNVELFVGDVYRARGDLNRRPTRSTTKFRRQVSEAINNASKIQSSGGVLLLLDVHSFPDSETWGFDRDRSFELVVLDLMPGSDRWRESLVKRLRREYGVDVGYVVGSQENDIMLEARTAGLPAILLEFNESLNDDRISAIARALVHVL
jgi:hypothetical protein